MVAVIAEKFAIKASQLESDATKHSWPSSSEGSRSRNDRSHGEASHAEASPPESSYEVPDLDEAWFLPRRVLSTHCQNYANHPVRTILAHVYNPLLFFADAGILFAGLVWFTIASFSFIWNHSLAIVVILSAFSAALQYLSSHAEEIERSSFGVAVSTVFEQATGGDLRLQSSETSGAEIDLAEPVYVLMNISELPTRRPLFVSFARPMKRRLSNIEEHLQSSIGDFEHGEELLQHAKAATADAQKFAAASEAYDASVAYMWATNIFRRQSRIVRDILHEIHDAQPGTSGTDATKISASMVPINITRSFVESAQEIEPETMREPAKYLAIADITEKLQHQIVYILEHYDLERGRRDRICAGPRNSLRNQMHSWKNECGGRSHKFCCIDFDDHYAYLRQLHLRLGGLRAAMVGASEDWQHFQHSLEPISRMKMNLRAHKSSLSFDDAQKFLLAADDLERKDKAMAKVHQPQWRAPDHDP